VTFRSLPCCIALACLACQHGAPSVPVPARLSEPSDRQLQELQTVIAGAVGRDSIRLGENPFANGHILVLEPSLRDTPQGRVATGATRTRPPTFHLLTDGGKCLLKDMQTERLYPLSFDCRAILE